MENCFIVTDQSKLHKEYFDYRNNIKIIDDIAKKLMEKHNIQTKFYYLSVSLLSSLLSSTIL